MEVYVLLTDFFIGDLFISLEINLIFVIILRVSLIGGEIMANVEATSDVFLIAFRALPKKTREAVIAKMLSDKEFMEDLIDTVIIEQRRKEPSRNLDEYIADRRKKGK